MHSKRKQNLPSHHDPRDLAESFSDFFFEKTSKIRKAIEDTPESNALLPPAMHCDASFERFEQTNVTEVAKLLSLTAKSCALDPVPIWILKECTNVVPILTQILNQSISEATVPPQLKTALVTPVHKKPSLECEDLNNFRPVSNLSLVSKMLEKVISHQLTLYCDANDLNTQLQSAYKKVHSTETALLRVQNDLLRAVDNQGGAILVLLDLSAAFDTIDHRVLLRTLETLYGIKGAALQWLSSYISDRCQVVKIGAATSAPKPLKFGVPQGSVLGPQLFTMYTRPLATVIESMGMDFHLYADDTQLYLSFNPKSTSSIQNAITTITNCTNAISAWMKNYFLKLNSTKTEVLIITQPSVKSPLISAIEVCGASVPSSTCVRDLGVLFDSHMDLKEHVEKICAKAYYQLHLIGRVRKYIGEDAAKQLVHTNVISHIDYCNALLLDLPDYVINKLQRVQNHAARLVKRTNIMDSTTPLLKDLHWLPVRFRIQYKNILLIHKCLNGMCPPYLTVLINRYVPTRTLRSQNEFLLSRVDFKLKKYGGRSFSHTSPVLWNSLPLTLRSCTSFHAFKKQLKTHLFRIAFNC